MRELKIATAQFQPKDGDKTYNLSVIEALTAKAKDKGAQVVSFHEMCVSAYTFFKSLNKKEAFDMAEEVPDGKSTKKLISLAKKYDVSILAGLPEKENDHLFNTYQIAVA